nr:ATP-binding protein [Sunxiuqinia sp.]
MRNIVRIAITGPESTAKSTLAQALADHFDGIFFPEYAREYFREHSTEYTYQDLEWITKKQIQQYHESSDCRKNLVFFDTWLISTKIWFQWAYQTEPAWLETFTYTHLTLPKNREVLISVLDTHLQKK